MKILLGVIIALFLFGYVYAIFRDILFNQPIDIIAVILIDPFLLLLSIVIAHKLVDAVSGIASFHIKKQDYYLYRLFFDKYWFICGYLSITSNNF